MALAVRHRPLTAEVCVRFQVSPCGFCGGHSDTGAVFCGGHSDTRAWCSVVVKALRY
jgi:hypothetical protein